MALTVEAQGYPGWDLYTFISSLSHVSAFDWKTCKLLSFCCSWFDPLAPQNSLLIETSNKSIKNMLTASCLENVGLIEKGQILLSNVKDIKRSHKKIWATWNRKRSCGIPSLITDHVNSGLYDLWSNTTADVVFFFFPKKWKIVLCPQETVKATHSSWVMWFAALHFKYVMSTALFPELKPRFSFTSKGTSGPGVI